MKYKNFLFDWDGSLANTLTDWFLAHKKILLQNGIEVTDEVLCQEVFGRLDVKDLGVVDEEKFADDVEAEILSSLDAAVLNPGALEFLTAIKKAGGKIGIVTNSKKRWVKHALRNNGLRDIVDVFLGREDITNQKPDPEIIQKALNFMGGKLEETLMIGDNWRDVMAAREAGVDCALYFPEEYEKYYVANSQRNLAAKYLVKSFSELEAIVMG